MEASTAPVTSGSSTIADLLPTRSGGSGPDHAAQRHKVDGEWVDITFAEVGERVSESAAA